MKQCGEDLSRENIANQARSTKDLVLPTALPGIKINTSETTNQAWSQVQIGAMEWNELGKVWRFTRHRKQVIVGLAPGKGYDHYG